MSYAPNASGRRLVGSRGKEAAAREAARWVAERITSGDVAALGVGTGSTVALVLEHLHREGVLRSVRLVASSLDTQLRLARLGYDATSLLPRSGVDLYVDGADEVSFLGRTHCLLVKGRGAAMTREKLLAFHSKLSIAVVDESKLASRPGELGKPVPVEVIPPALEATISFLEGLGVRVEARSCNCRDGPAVTDNCGVVLDTWPWESRRFQGNVLGYETILETLPGVIGHGLFRGLFNYIVVGYDDGRVEWRECRRAWGRGAAGGVEEATSRA